MLHIKCGKPRSKNKANDVYKKSGIEALSKDLVGFTTCPRFSFAQNGLFLRVGRFLKADESSDIKKRNTRSNYHSSNNSHGIYGLEGHENPASGSNEIGRPLKAKFLFLFNKFLKSRMVLHTMSRYGSRGLT